jgi:hypothetical protein
MPRCAEPRLQHAAEQDLVDRVAGHPGTVERGTHRPRTQLRRGNVLEGAPEGPYWRADRTYNYGLIHMLLEDETIGTPRLRRRLSPRSPNPHAVTRWWGRR